MFFISCVRAGSRVVFLVIIQEIIFGIINCFEGRHIIIPWEYLILSVGNQKDDRLGHTPQAWRDQHSRKTTFHRHDESAAWTVLVSSVSLNNERRTASSNSNEQIPPKAIVSSRPLSSTPGELLSIPVPGICLKVGHLNGYKT